VLLLSVADGTLLGELRAVDVPTGRTLWAQEGSAAATNLIVLDDTVYGSTGQTLWARDLATGRTVWETATDQSQTAGYLLTDGSALLRSETDRRAGEAVLAAYGLHDGEQRWTTPLPDGITSAAVVGDLLVGWGAAGPRVLG
jgi:outer membrane protein assembly factor BamB